MELERIESPGLAHYSYIVVDPAAGKMAVVDPRRDIDAYLHYAKRRQLEIAHILETHIHADYCSGARELSVATGAPVSVSGHDEGETFAVSFPHRDVRDGDQIEFGSTRVRALHTPGHTPEHISFLLFDLQKDPDRPAALLSGDFLFIGSLGRPDLLGEDQKLALARQMFQSVRVKLPPLPDDLEVYPAHGAGSMCGSGMSGRAESTLGLERAGNPYLDPDLSEDEFVERLLTDVPPFPPYYRRMKKVNSAGPALLGARQIPALDPAKAEKLIAEGAAVIDLRDQISFGEGHIPGSLSIGLANQLPVWAAWLVPYDTPIVLVSNHPQEAQSAATLLARVGLDDIAGVLAGGVHAWVHSGRRLETLPQRAPRDLAIALRNGDDVAVLDVSSDREWNAARIVNALHEFGGTIEENLGNLPPRDHPIVVTCGGGYRSSAVASVLLRHGFSRVANLTGGMSGWMQAGLPVTTGLQTPAARVSL